LTETLADLALAALLAANAVWCALLHRRLRRLGTAERGELEAFVAALGAASGRAESAIAGLREAALEAEARLREQGDSARQRGGELARLVESGSRLARRLEADLGHGARGLAAATGGPGRAGLGPARGRLDQDADRPPAFQRPGPSAARPPERHAPADAALEGAPTAPLPPPPDALLRALETLR
jgi:hypothetical protein